MIQTPSFKEKQLEHSRVKAAYSDKEESVKGYFKNKNIAYNSFHLFLRAFKKEGLLEVWIKSGSLDTYTLLHTYDFCMLSGTLGPKRKEGDLQVPEGVYQINHFNPLSNFHLSLGINYPNNSDKILSNRQRPGGSIYIHGNCVSIGCIPITDEKIKELYILAVEARNYGQEKIPVHIFPAMLNKTGMDALTTEFANQADLLHFWANLKTVYDAFETSRKLPRIRIDNTGRYTAQ
jgi:murein L,D-transpeptidase YafK